MPYSSNSDLPSAIRQKYGKCASAFRAAFNTTYERTGSESRSFATAHAAAQRCQRKETGMSVAPAASKLPPGEFRVYTSHDHPLSIVTKALEEGQPERRRFSTVISSTVRDLGGDEMKMTALEDMRDAFRSGVPMFMNHDYKVPDSSFGMSDYAEIKDSGVVDETGNTVWDLHISGFVDEANPIAVQLANSISGGMKFGASVGAIVTKHKTNEVGGKDIFHVNLKEGSIVGLPMNQRSLVATKAAQAAAALDESEPEEENMPKVPQATTKDATKITTDQIADPPEIEVKGDGCSDCGHSAGCGCDDCSCGASYHGESKSIETAADLGPDAKVASADINEETTTDGQEASEATPDEPVAADPTDPAVEQKAEAFEAAEVVQLVEHVKTLVSEIDRLRIDNANLQSELTTLKDAQGRIASEVSGARAEIEKALQLPLRPQAQGHLEGMTKQFPFLDPKVAAYLNRTGDHS